MLVIRSLVVDCDGNLLYIGGFFEADGPPTLAVLSGIQGCTARLWIPIDCQGRRSGNIQ